MNPVYQPLNELPAGCENVTGLHGNEKASDRLRNISDIDTIVLHHCACLIGPRSKQWYTVSCHTWACQDGSCGLNYNPRSRVWHSHSINGRSLGIEVDGDHRGQETESGGSSGRTNGGPHELTEAQIASTKAMIKWMVDEVSSMGGRITQLVSHRQCSDQRDSDPGELIWCALAPYCEIELGLEVNCARTYGTGSQVPRSWDPLSLWGWESAWTKRVDSQGVKDLQATLNFIRKTMDVDTVNRFFSAGEAERYWTNGLTVDGGFGDFTTKVLKVFQAMHGLDPDAVIGRLTYRKLRPEIRAMHEQTA